MEAAQTELMNFVDRNAALASQSGKLNIYTLTSIEHSKLCIVYYSVCLHTVKICLESESLTVVHCIRGQELVKKTYENYIEDNVFVIFFLETEPEIWPMGTMGKTERKDQD